MYLQITAILLFLTYFCFCLMFPITWNSLLKLFNLSHSSFSSNLSSSSFFCFRDSFFSAISRLSFFFSQFFYQPIFFGSVKIVSFDRFLFKFELFISIFKKTIGIFNELLKLLFVLACFENFGVDHQIDVLKDFFKQT